MCHFVEQLLGVGQVWVAGGVTCEEGVADVDVAREAGLGHLRMHDSQVLEGGKRGEQEREGVAVGADAEAEEAAEKREREAVGAALEGAEDGVEYEYVGAGEGGEEGERGAEVAETAAGEEEGGDDGGGAQEGRFAEDGAA